MLAETLNQKNFIALLSSQKHPNAVKVIKFTITRLRLYIAKQLINLTQLSNKLHIENSCEMGKYFTKCISNFILKNHVRIMQLFKKGIAAITLKKKQQP